MKMNQPDKTIQIKWYPPLQKNKTLKSINQVTLNKSGFLFGLTLRTALLQHMKDHINRSDIKKFLDPVLRYEEPLMGSSLVLLIHPVFDFLLFCRILRTNKPTNRRMKTQPPLVEVITGKRNILGFLWPQVRKIVNRNHILFWKK